MKVMMVVVFRNHENGIECRGQSTNDDDDDGVGLQDQCFAGGEKGAKPED